MNQWYLTAGDFGFNWAEQIRSLSWLPQVYQNAVGFGGSQLPVLWLGYPISLVLKVLDHIGLSWWTIEKLLWGTVFTLAIYSSFSLARYIVKSRLSSWAASVIYATNTYFLLLFGGRQLGVALGYAFSPFVLLRVIQSIDRKGQIIKDGLINGLCLALLVAFDLRLAYMVLGGIVLYYVFTKTFNFVKLGIACMVAMLMHSFWILPTVLSQIGPSVMGEDFTNPGMLKFLSVADFSHSISLLHPNWPENLFGKVYFLQPEFLVLPLIAFVSLLLLRRAKNKQHIMYFALLSLIGAFLSKGVHPPAGTVFQWMFQNVPGFVMFRDPTKFYLLTAIGYAVLIPFTLLQMSKLLQKKRFLPYILFGIFWIFTIRAAFTGEGRGNFHFVQLPQEYVLLKDQLVLDKEPSRTLWIPNKENFAYYSDVHPLVHLQQVFKDISMSEIPLVATDASFLATLNSDGVKYVIVPIDVEGKLFMNNYVYDDQLREQLIAVLQQTGLKQLMEYKKIAVFENQQFQGMNITVPGFVQWQQDYANIGVIISALVLVIVILLILWL